jgi:outer membrane protein assembly factor BamB/2-polyprenyl-3-methyl-5-hydroxy-6-metoxy-1,4-benzoquinol methylase
MQLTFRFILFVMLLGCCRFSTIAQSPIHHWRLGAPASDKLTIEDLTGSKEATLVGEAEFEQIPPSMRLSGKPNYLGVVAKGTPVSLPTAAISLEAWVALEKATKYNNIVGYLQDNGSFEKGWLLGGHDTRFQFAIGTDRLTYLKSKTEFEPSRWYHVVGSYDGTTMRLYVNGELETTSTKRQGPIQYADSWWRIAGYKDDNETYAFHGRLHEIAIHDRALAADQIRSRYQASKNIFPPPPIKPEEFIALGPYLQFESPTTATLRWQTHEPQTSRIQYRMSGAEWIGLEEQGLLTNHTIQLSDLPFRSKFQYRVLGQIDERSGQTDEVSVNTTFNFTTPQLPANANPYPNDELTTRYAAAAERILAKSGITNGYCLDFNCGDGRLAVELARRSNLVIVGLNQDATVVSEARQRLLKAGLYGQRITIQHAPNGRIPFPDYCFNLVVSDESIRTGSTPKSTSDLKRHVRPAGGVMMLANEHYIRPTLEGAGSWTHMYGDAGQSANSHDQLISGKTGENIEVQWFGLPGPDAMIDRLGRNQGPLSYQGRLFTQGDDRLIVQDSYNGRILWTLEIPGMRRTNVKVDTSNSCVDEQAYYLAIRDRCWKIDVATGQLLESLAVSDEANPDLAWGYIASDRHLLIGSAVRKGASFSDFHGADKWYDKPTGVGTEKVCSDNLFAIDKDSGTRLWTYERGAVLNPTISLGDGLVYFLESRHPKVLSSSRGRIGMPELYEDLHLVALNQESGSVVWEKPVHYGKQPTVVYLVHSPETLVVQSSLPDDKTYNLHTYEAGNGEELWNHKYPWRRSDHGHHVQHPVIAGNRLVAQPEFFELRTGKKLGDTPERRKCSTMTGAANLLHYRDFYDEVWDLSTGETSEWKGLRSGCWLGIVSADGLILSSESGGGCSCNFPIQLSIGYRTKNDY